MQGLKLIHRTNSPRCWNLASYHPQHSLTWRWVLSLTLPAHDQVRWFFFHRYRDSGGLSWHLSIAKFELAWHTQQPMRQNIIQPDRSMEE
jgi:hypothetical protein